MGTAQGEGLVALNVPDPSAAVTARRENAARRASAR